MQVASRAGTLYLLPDVPVRLIKWDRFSFDHILTLIVDFIQVPSHRIVYDVDSLLQAVTNNVCMNKHSQGFIGTTGYTYH